MTNENPHKKPWDSLAAELQAYRKQQQQTWGDVDNTLLACYLSGEIEPDERAEVESALAAHPELQNLTDLVKEVLDDFDHEVPAEPVANQSTTLKFTTKPRRGRSHWRHLGALAAAAMVLLALGTWLLPSPSSSKSSPAIASAGLFAATPNVEEGTAERARLSNVLAENRLSFDAEPSDAVIQPIVKVLTASAVRSPYDELYQKGQAQLLFVYERQVEQQLSAEGPRSFGARDNKKPRWVSRNVTYLLDGAQQSEKTCRETYNRYAWTLAHLDRETKNSVPPRQRQVLTRALQHYRACKPTRTGIHDDKKVLPVLARKLLDSKLSELSKQHDVAVVAETYAKLPADAMETYRQLPERQQRIFLKCWTRTRSRELGAGRDVYVCICKEPQIVEVVLGRNAQKHETWRQLARVVQWEAPTFEPVRASFTSAAAYVGDSAGNVLQSSMNAFAGN